MNRPLSPDTLYFKFKKTQNTYVTIITEAQMLMGSQAQVFCGLIGKWYYCINMLDSWHLNLIQYKISYLIIYLADGKNGKVF